MLNDNYLKKEIPSISVLILFVFMSLSSKGQEDSLAIIKELTSDSVQSWYCSKFIGMPVAGSHYKVITLQIKKSPMYASWSETRDERELKKEFFGWRIARYDSLDYELVLNNGVRYIIKLIRDEKTKEVSLRLRQLSRSFSNDTYDFYFRKENTKKSTSLWRD